MNEKHYARREKVHTIFKKMQTDTQNVELKRGSFWCPPVSYPSVPSPSSELGEPPVPGREAESLWSRQCLLRTGAQQCGDVALLDI